MGRVGLIALLLLGACVVGESQPPGGDDAGETPAPEQTTAVTGTTVDAFTGAVLGEIRLETLGLAPERMSESDAGGAVDFDVPVGSAFFVRTGATETHRPTISPLVASGEAAEIPAYSIADINRQHVTAGVEVAPDTSAVIVELTGVEGAPVAPFSRANLSIVDVDSGAVIAAEPLVVGALGDVDPTLSESPEGAVAGFMFLNVEAGSWALVVTCPECEPAYETSQALVAAPGVTVAKVTLGAEQGPPADSFEAIYPLFARGVDGGLGCANCHTAGQTAPVLDGDPAAVREALLAMPGVVDLDAPDLSQLLSRPLYETPANHPNATFLSTDDPGYQAIRTWIAGGAL